MANHVLEVSNLTTWLASEQGWLQAIDALSLTLSKGETFALVGESGCGKSMAALSILRLLPECGAILQGQVKLLCDKAHAETDLLQITEAQMRAFRGRRVSMIFQEPGTSLNPVLTVGEQLAEVIRLHTPRTAFESKKIAMDWLGQVGLDQPDQQYFRYPFELSGGQKQRVMIAMALCTEPDVLIADEPTTALDVSIQKQVLDLLVSLQQKKGMAMLMITHDLAVVRNMAQHVALMYAGQLVESAPAEQFFKTPKHPYARALMASLPAINHRGSPLRAIEGQVPSLINPKPGCRFAPRCAEAKPFCSDTLSIAFDACNHEKTHWVRCLRHHEFIQQPAQAIHQVATGQDTLKTSTNLHTHQQPVLKVSKLNVSYAEKQGFLKRHLKPVVDNLEFQIVSGQTLALVGESGSGKTTAAKAILKLLPGSAHVSGDILFKNQPLNTLPERGLSGWRARMQFVFQDPFASLNPRHRVIEILQESLSHLCPALSPHDRQARIIEVLNQVQLPQTALMRYPHEFSGGQRQRVAIARALVSKPDVLICDEPTSALDVSVQAQILNLLRQLQQETQVGMLFITHNLAVVQYIADTVIVLQRGRLVEVANTLELFSSPQHAYTQQLLAAAPQIG